MVIMQHASYVFFRNTTSCLPALNNFTFDPYISILVVERKLDLKNILGWRCFGEKKSIIKLIKHVLGFFPSYGKIWIMCPDLRHSVTGYNLHIVVLVSQQ